MSKAASYVVVGVVAFLAGGFSFELLGRAGEGKADSQSVDGRARGGEATAVVPREFVIEGMTCQGCADSISSALTQVPGVKSAKVSLADKRAVVLAGESEVPAERILAAIATAGYKGQLASAAQSTPATAAAPTKQPILVNITRGKNELHAVSMALALAQSALKDGRRAAVFLHVEAPVLAAKNMGDDVKYADFPPIKRMLADFIAAGGRVLVCGHCAHVVKQSSSVPGGAETMPHAQVYRNPNANESGQISPIAAILDDLPSQGEQQFAFRTCSVTRTSIHSSSPGAGASGGRL
jgi:copper chaperone CopZ/predicted peroxiredoxin